MALEDVKDEFRQRMIIVDRIYRLPAHRVLRRYPCNSVNEGKVIVVTVAAPVSSRRTEIATVAVLLRFGPSTPIVREKLVSGRHPRRLRIGSSSAYEYPNT